MLKRKNDFSNISSFTIGNNISPYSLETFRKELEKEYFGEVNIEIINCDELGSDLFIDIQWNFSLFEFLNQLRKRNIGQVNRINIDDFQEVAFSNAFEHLRTQNVRPIGLEELHFSLSDCEINIRKIYPNSIEDQLGNIYKMLARHYMNYTYEQSRKPSEIFIPVYEENLEKKFQSEFACGRRCFKQTRLLQFLGNLFFS